MSDDDLRNAIRFYMAAMANRKTQAAITPRKTSVWTPPRSGGSDWKKRARTSGCLSRMKMTYRLLQSSQQLDTRSGRHRQTSLPTSISGIRSTWATRLSRTPQLPDCQSWSWWRQGHSLSPERRRFCSRQCRHCAWPLEAVSRQPWLMSTTLRRPWRGLEVLRGLRGSYCAIKSMCFVQPDCECWKWKRNKKWRN